MTIENLEEYVDLMSKFLLKDGIEKQMESFKSKHFWPLFLSLLRLADLLHLATDDVDSVFSIDSLKCFEPSELQLLISGDQAPKWTYEEIIKYTEPKLGYTKDR